VLGLLKKVKTQSDNWNINSHYHCCQRHLVSFYLHMDGS